MLQIQGGLSNTFFKPNGFCVNLLTRTFRIKNDKYPKKSRVVGGGGIFPINSVQCLVIHLMYFVTPVSRQAFLRNASPKTGGKQSICEK